MNLLLRTLTLIALLTVAPLTQLHLAAQSTAEPVAVAIDGDAIGRLARSSPAARSQVVVGQGVYIREANGEWTRTGDAPGPGSVVFAADDPNLLLSGDHPPCLRGGAVTPLERSEDGGASWNAVPGAQGVRPLAIWSQSGIALGATCSGLMLSTDAGETWSDLAGIEAGYEITAFAPVAFHDETDGPVVLFGMTSEGGTSRLYRLDLSDPTHPQLSEPLREYWAVAGLAARDDTYVLAAADGVWVSRDAGQSWERSADGLEDVVLEADPNQSGLPADIEPGSFGFLSAAFLSEDSEALVVGSANGLYAADSAAGPWTLLGGTRGEIPLVAVILDADPALYAQDDMVFEVSISAAEPSTADGSREGTVIPAIEATAQDADD